MYDYYSIINLKLILNKDSTQITRHTKRVIQNPNNCQISENSNSAVGLVDGRDKSEECDLNLHQDVRRSGEFPLRRHVREGGFRTAEVRLLSRLRH